MKYQLRDYQQAASDAAVEFFNSKKAKYNAIEILPTAAGKSLVLSDIANRLSGGTLVLQPSREILLQNYNKLRSYDVEDCSIYSASCGSKEISRITFATIGSIIGKKEDFEHFGQVIIDECHLVSAKAGMYVEFIKATKRKVLGLTATPFRLSTSSVGSMLKFITRTSPKIFNKVIYCVQVRELLERGYLAKLNYYTVLPNGYNRKNLINNSTGADFTDTSVKAEYMRTDYYSHLCSIVWRLLHPKSAVPRNGILVFTRFVEEAVRLTNNIPDCAYVSGDTPKSERERILKDFNEGRIKVLANCGTLVCGYDRPDLDTIVLAKPTKSLSYYYQVVGRAMRLSDKKKEAWIVDICGNINMFGKVEDLTVVEAEKNKWEIMSNGRKLTNVPL